MSARMCRFMLDFAGESPVAGGERCRSPAIPGGLTRAGAAG